MVCEAQTGHSVTRAASNTDRMQTVAIDDFCIDSDCMVYMLQYNLTHDKFRGTFKVKDKDPADMQWVREELWSPFVPSPP